MAERRAVEGLPTPFPLGSMLPGLYQGDDFTQRFTSGLDEVLAPVLCVLDCLDAYLDPLLAPDDFAGWLACWVGVTLDEHWPLERQREMVRRAVELYSWRGTTFGIAEVVRLYTGAAVEVADSGGVVVSSTPGAPLPGSADPVVGVVISTAEPDTIDAERVGHLVAAAKPAHVTHRVEVGGP